MPTVPGLFLFFKMGGGFKINDRPNIKNKGDDRKTNLEEWLICRVNLRKTKPFVKDHAGKDTARVVPLS